MEIATLNNSNASHPNVTFQTEQSGNYTLQEDVISRIIFHCIMYPVIIILGTIGNALTLKIFAAKEQSVKKMFILSLTTSDLCLLCTNIPVVVHAYIVAINFYSDGSNTINTPFAFLNLLSKFPDRIGKLLTVAMMVERFIAVCFPLRFRHIVNKGRARNVIVSIVLFVFVTNIPFTIDALYYYITNHPEEGYESDWQENFIKEYMYNLIQQKSWLLALHFVNKVIMDYVSIITIFILSVATAVGIRKQIDPNLLQFSSSEIIERKKRERKITTILMTISLTLCLLNAPGFVMIIMVELRIVLNMGAIATNSITSLIVLNSAINFMIFGMSDKTLREEYIQALKCRRQVQPSSQRDKPKSNNISQTVL